MMSCQLDKEGEGFEVHTKQNHYLWGYLYYIYYLRMKDQTEYNGIESYVHALIEQDDIGWFPVERALSIERKNGKRYDPMTEMDLLEKNLEDIVNLKISG